MHRRHRLAHRGQFDRVRRSGRSWAGPLLVLVALENELPDTRFGFLVSKRVGKAVVRNRVRRLLREAARARLPALSAGWDLMLIARTGAAQADLSSIEASLDALLLRANLVVAPAGARATKE
jgi:ribonuclease P protein component